MRVVIDSNVVVSAALKDRDPEDIILFVVQHPDFEWVATREIVEEYTGVLHRDKFHFSEEILRHWDDFFKMLITIVEVKEKIDFPRDPKDAMFIECALSAMADYFITGDKDFSGAYKIGSAIVLSVSMFKRLVCDIWGNE
ncbi:MAG: putative toxin-antitoxin system toxin component, PIN family [Chloroflexota bacterium]|jgi:putative PIN family toxin of toxin-antitoxin system